MFLLLIHVFAAGRCEWHLTLEAKIQERRAEIAREVDDARAAARHGRADQARFEVAKLVENFRAKDSEDSLQEIARLEVSLAEIGRHLSELDESIPAQERRVRALEALVRRSSTRVAEHGPGIWPWFRRDYWRARGKLYAAEARLALERSILLSDQETRTIRADTAATIRGNIEAWRGVINGEAELDTRLAKAGLEIARLTLETEILRATLGAVEYPEYARSEALIAALKNTDQGRLLTMERHTLGVVAAAFVRLKGALTVNQEELASDLREFDPHCAWLKLPKVSDSGSNPEVLDAHVRAIAARLESKRAEIEAESAQLVRETLSSIDVNLDPPN